MVRRKSSYSTERNRYSVISAFIRNVGKPHELSALGQNSAGKEDSLVLLLQKLVGLVWSYVYLKQRLLLLWEKPTQAAQKLTSLFRKLDYK